MPTSALRSAGPSFVPSPMNPQICPLLRRFPRIVIFCSGVTCNSYLDIVGTIVIGHTCRHKMTAHKRQIRHMNDLGLTGRVVKYCVMISRVAMPALDIAQKPGCHTLLSSLVFGTREGTKGERHWVGVQYLREDSIAIACNVQLSILQLS